MSVVGAIELALPEVDSHVWSTNISGCRFLLRAMHWRDGSFCREHTKWVIDELAKFPEDVPVVIINRTTASLFGENEFAPSLRKPLIYYGDGPHESVSAALSESYRKDLISTLCEVSLNRATFVVLPIPDLGINVGKVGPRRSRFGLPSDITIERVEYDKRHEFVRKTLESAASECGVRLLDPVDYLCDDFKCWGSRNGEFYYYDDDHLSETGNRLLIPMFRQIWE